MTDSTTPRTRITRGYLRISASSGSPLAPPRAAPCVTSPLSTREARIQRRRLGPARPRAHAAAESVIRRRPVKAGAPWTRAVGGGRRVGQGGPVAVEVSAGLAGRAAIPGRTGAALRPALPPEARGGTAVVAAERLGELGGLAVAHPAGHLPDRERALPQELERTAHPDLRQVGAEARLAGLRECALELAARGGQAPGHGVELEVARVLALDDVDGLLEEGPPPEDCSGSDGHFEARPSGW